MTDRPLAGRTAAVLHADSGPGAELARGLADLGATLTRLDAGAGAGPADPGATLTPSDTGGGAGPADPGVTLTPSDTGGGAGPADPGVTLTPSDTGGGAGPADLVVVPVLPLGDGAVRRPLVDLDPAGWAEACEAPLLAARRGLVAARRALTGGGTIVVVGPVAAITGEAGLVGYAAAGEGARTLALSCARAWGAHGITVHWVATLTSLLTGAEGAERVTLWDEALGRPPTLRGDVAAAVAGLAAPTMRFVTGTSIAVDGGVVLHT